MKKTYASVTLLLAIVTLVCAVLNPILTEKPALVTWIMVAILGLGTIGLWAIPCYAKNKLLTLIPVLALVAVSDYIQTMLSSVLSLTGEELSAVLPKYYEFETLGFMLSIAFVVAAVFALTKGYKWAITTALVYSALLLVCEVQMFLTYTSAASIGSSFGSDKKAVVALLLLAVSFVTAKATMVTMFAGLENKPEEQPLTQTPEESDF